MLRVLLHRIAWALPVLLIVATLVFLLMHAVPGSPWEGGVSMRALPNEGADSLTRAALDQRYGLDQPLWKQYLRYFVGYTDRNGAFRCGIICGNLGPSYRQAGRTVENILFSPPENQTVWQSRAAYSLRLGLYAFIFALATGLPLGIIAAVRQNRPVDVTIRTFTAIGAAIPNFVLGLILIMVLGTGLGVITLLPGSWATAGPGMWVVPVFVLGFGSMTAIARLTRASVLETMRQDYVRTARAKGLREQTVIRLHVLKNAMIPIVTMLGPIMAELITGTFVIEYMFGLPGIGREYVESVVLHDYAMVLGATLLYAMLIVLVNLSVDVVYSLTDPRARIE
jgi:oligopeptide transport system permease protein